MIDRDLELILTVDLVERGIHGRPGLTEDIALEIIPILVVDRGLDQIDMHFLNRVTEIKHPLLENSEGILPRNIAHKSGTDAVHKGAQELVAGNVILHDPRNSILDVPLSRLRNHLLVVAACIGPYRIQNINIIHIITKLRHNLHSLLEKIVN